MRRAKFLCLLSPLIGFSFSAKAAPTRYVEGEVIVTFKGTVSLDRARRAISARSLRLARHFPKASARRGRHRAVVSEKTRTTLQLIAELKTDEEIESVEPNFLRWISAPPNDARFGELWALQNSGQNANGTTGTAGADVKFLAAQSLTQPNPGAVVVGVIDTGVDFVHPDLAPNMWTNPAEIPNNGLDDDRDGYVDDFHGYDFVGDTAQPTDSGDHGTHVAGTIAAIGNNQTGVIGIAPRAKIMALKVSADGDTISTSATIEAIEYATTMNTRGVNVVSLNASYGGGGNSGAESAAIQAAGSAGIVFCAAAGNESANNDATATYPANYRLANMIVVAASTQTDGLAGFSNYGATKVDLAAPGDNILSTVPASPVLSVGASTYSGNYLDFSGRTPGLTGAVYDCGIGNPSEFPAAVSGQIALIARGTLNFSTKVENAMAAGARAAIIYNNVAGNFSGTLQSASNWIPALSISQANGQAIRAALPTNATISVAGNYQFLDGTSMATPQVAGAVAFAAFNFPNETPTQRIQRILTQVDVRPAFQGKTVTGGRLNLLRIVDTDSDTLPDWWETNFYGQTSGGNAASDSDGDGQGAGAEFLAGTSPVDAQSSLKVVNFSEEELTGGMTISWTAVPSKTYRVAYTEQLPAMWKFDLPNSVITAAAGQTILNYTDVTASGLLRRFYRVEVVP